jgi:hypothetical protein
MLTDHIFSLRMEINSVPPKRSILFTFILYGVNDSKYSSLLTNTFDLVITVPLEVIHCLNFVYRLRLNKIKSTKLRGQDWFPSSRKRVKNVLIWAR